MLGGSRGGLSAFTPRWQHPSCAAERVGKALRLEADELLQFLVPWLHGPLNVC